LDISDSCFLGANSIVVGSNFVSQSQPERRTNSDEKQPTESIESSHVGNFFEEVASAG
jgi:hypothetical protein